MTDGWFTIRANRRHCLRYVANMTTRVMGVPVVGGGNRKWGHSNASRRTHKMTSLAVPRPGLGREAFAGPWLKASDMALMSS